VYKSNKDTRNAPLWNPSSAKLLNLEADDAGRLRAFREKFGRGWDAERMDAEDGKLEEEEEEENLMDLITGYGEKENGNENGKGKGNDG
jgi:hypothetical protein